LRDFKGGGRADVGGERGLLVNFIHGVIYICPVDDPPLSIRQDLLDCPSLMTSLGGYWPQWLCLYFFYVQN